MTVARSGLAHREGAPPDKAGSGPTVARIRLGTRLRRLREEAGISREEACAAIRASSSKISRIELGRTAIKARDLTDLLALYRADETERETLVTLSRHGSVSGWWQDYGDSVPAWMKPYLGLEQAARLIRSYDVPVVSGLLQTPEYARALFSLGGSSGERAERQLAVRMRRQEILHGADPPHLWAVIDEAALRRPVGGNAVMRAQIEHLIEISQLRHVNLQVLPFSAGGHPAGSGPFILLRFAGEHLPDVVYLEQLTSASYPSGTADLAYYWDTHNQLVTKADPPIATTAILDQIRGEL